MTPQLMHWCRTCGGMSPQVMFFTIWGNFFRWCLSCGADSIVVEVKR